MTRDQYISLARRAGFEVDAEGRLCLYGSSPALMKPNYEGTLVDGMKKMVDLAIADEREACADECVRLAIGGGVAADCAAAIRARGQA